MGDAAVPETRESIVQEYAKRIYEITTSEPLNQTDLFDLLSEILWKYAEDSKYDMWDAVFKSNHDGHAIADLLTKLFVIDSKWLQLIHQEHEYRKPGPSILFLELLLHIIQYINHQEDKSEPKLKGVIRIVNRSDNSNILNLGIPDDGVLFFKQCSREPRTDIDSVLNGINHEFDSNKFRRSGNYTLSHVVTSFCEQLLEPPEGKQRSNVDAKINAENEEKSSAKVSNIRVIVLNEQQQDRLDIKEGQKLRVEQIRLEKIKKEEAARKRQQQVVDDLRRHVERTKAAAAAAAAAAAGPVPRIKQCRYGYACRIHPETIEKNGRSHKNNYSHPDKKPIWRPGGGGSRNKQTNRNSRGCLSTKRSKRTKRTRRHTRSRRR